MLSAEKCGLFKETANYEECVALVPYYLLPDPPEKESLMKEVGGAKWLMYISVVNEAFGRYARHFFSWWALTQQWQDSFWTLE